MVGLIEGKKLELIDLKDSLWSKDEPLKKNQVCYFNFAVKVHIGKLGVRIPNTLGVVYKVGC